MECAVFLDRDNTLIANDGDLGDPEDVDLLDGVASGLRALREAGYRLIVVTNQGGVARGSFTEDDVDAVHQRIALLVDEGARGSHLINRFYYCPYHPEAMLEEYRRDHPWRKPHPGMILQAARDMNLDLARCWMVGDQARDIEAGRSAGCRTVLLSPAADLAAATRPTLSVATFSDAVDAILRQGPAPGNGNGEIEAAHEPRPGERPPARERPARDPGNPLPASDLEPLRHAITELTQEIRSDRERRAEFTGFRLAAGMCQLLAVLVALLGLLQLGSEGVFLKWMIGAALVQLLTIAILLLDLKG